MSVFTAQGFAAAQRKAVVAAPTMLMTTDTTDSAAFSTPTSDISKTTAFLIYPFFDVNTFDGAIKIGLIVDFTGLAQIVPDGMVVIIADNDFSDFAKNTHCTSPPVKTMGFEKSYNQCIV